MAILASVCPLALEAELHWLCVGAAGRNVTSAEFQNILAGRQTFSDLRNAWFIQSAYVVRAWCVLASWIGCC